MGTYLDCGCYVDSDGRHLCPTCASGAERGGYRPQGSKDVPNPPHGGTGRVVPDASPAPDALRDALEWFCDQAECWLESRVPEARPGWVKPAIDKGRAALRSGDGWTRVEDGKPPSNIPVEVRVPCPFGFKFWAAERATHWRPLPPAPEDR